MTTRREFVAHAVGAAAACLFAESSAAGAQSTTTSTSSAQMLMRKIPSTGEPIPAVGLGTYNALSPRDVNEKTLAPLAEVLQIFVDAGGRVVDTAPSYGTAEEVVGILSEKLGISDKLFLATKVL